MFLIANDSEHFSCGVCLNVFLLCDMPVQIIYPFLIQLTFFSPYQLIRILYVFRILIVKYMIYLSVWAFIKNSIGWLKQQKNHCFTVLRARSPRSGCQNGRFLVRILFLACRQSPSHRVFTWLGGRGREGVWERKRERERALSGLFSYKGTLIPSQGLYPTDFT